MKDKAYCEHYSLELNVEDISAAIASDVCICLDENAEKYRQLIIPY